MIQASAVNAATMRSAPTQRTVRDDCLCRRISTTACTRLADMCTNARRWASSGCRRRQPRWRAVFSFGLDLRGLENLAPLGYLAPDEGGEFFRRARGDVHRVEALAYVRPAEHLADVVGEPVHDGGGRLGRSEYAEPER